MGEMTRGALIFTAAAGATGVGVGVLAQRNAPKRASAAKPGLRAGRTDGEIRIDGDADVWKEVEPLTVPVTPQRIVSPMLDQASLEEI